MARKVTANLKVCTSATAHTRTVSGKLHHIGDINEMIVLCSQPLTEYIQHCFNFSI